MMDAVGQTISEKKPGDIFFLDDGPDVRLWSTTVKCGKKFTMQFLLLRGR